MSPLHQIALTFLPGIGSVNARKLLNHFGGEEAAFEQLFLRDPGIPGLEGRSAPLLSPGLRAKALRQASAELELVRKHGIRMLFITGEEYPSRLRHCYDAPVLLYYKGSVPPDSDRIISIVGSRKATAYGGRLCRDLVRGLLPYAPVIVSGLAYGIDVAAHREALAAGLPTIGVLGHGFGQVYPEKHRSTAENMLRQGGLLTEFPFHAPALPRNFPKRNRIIAGMSDATIVVEAGRKGGALITADLACGYDREVFALPGRIGDVYSEGCHSLIMDHKARLITCADDIAGCMGWEKAKTFAPGLPGAAAGASSGRSLAASPPSAGLLPPADLSPSLPLEENEGRLLRIIAISGQAHIDELVFKSKMPINRLYSLLLSLELKGLVEKTPGNRYFIL